MYEYNPNLPTIWIFSLEPIETRYTGQWQTHVPALLKSTLSNHFNVQQIDGEQKHSRPTPGAFLNFSDTNFWKSSQLCNFLDRFNNGLVGKDDHVLFTDAWNPTIIQLRYMNDLLGFNWKFHGLWHAGSYDPADFLGRLIGDTPWVRHSEKAFFAAFDYNYFATEFHTNMFLTNLFGYKNDVPENVRSKIIQTGWPMEYLQGTMANFQNKPKRDLIVFPHRIAPEKQIDIFHDLKACLPQYEFVVCQDHPLTKDQYHTILSEAKIVFSANLQETLGISPYEGALVGAIPMVPDRLSYSEMYLPEFKYPSEWSTNWSSYKNNREAITARVVEYIKNYDAYSALLDKQLDILNKKFFSSSALLQHLMYN